MRSIFASCLRYSLIVLSLSMPTFALAQNMLPSHWTALFAGRWMVSSHLISLTATTPFPSEIAASGSASALYTVTNVGTIPLTGISTLLTETDTASALSISSSTCSTTSPLAIGDSCTISLSLQAPNAEATLSGTLYERALPSLDGVYGSIGPVHVNGPLTVTPSAGSNGTISPNSGQTVAYGGNTSFTATPSTGYSVNQWLVDNSPAQTGGASFTLSDVTENHTVSVSFAISQYTVTPSAGSNGVISPSTAQTVNYGDEVAFTAAPSTGYSVNQWLVDNSPVQTGGASFTLNDVTENHTVSVSFALNIYTVTPSAGSNGTISPSGVQSVVYGGSLTFTAAPDEGYNVNQWLVDDSLVQTGGSSLVLSNVTANHAVSVGFYVPLMVAVGTGLDSSPGIQQSINKGDTWQAKPIGGLTFVSGAFYDTSCTGAGPSAVCTAAGKADPDGAGSLPLLAVSRDNGDTWNAAAIPPFAQNTQFNTTSCTGSGDTAICLAAGSLPSSFVTPVLIQSTDGGQNWSAVTVGNLPANGTFIASSCTGITSNSVCTVVGGNVTTSAPLLLVGTAAGSSWNISTGLAAFSTVTLTTTSCTGSGNTAVCVVAGYNSVNGGSVPFIALSSDGGSTWAPQAIADLPAAGRFTSSSCTGSDNGVICSVAGVNNSENKALIAVLNTSSGINWTVPALNPAVSAGFTLTTTSCTGSGSTALCTAAGQNINTGAGTLIQSTNGGSSWTSSNIVSGMPASPGFRGSYCSVNQAICTAVGGTLLQTINSGGIWTIPTDGAATFNASSGT